MILCASVRRHRPRKATARRFGRSHRRAQRSSHRNAGTNDLQYVIGARSKPLVDQEIGKSSNSFPGPPVARKEPRVPAMSASIADGPGGVRCVGRKARWEPRRRSCGSVAYPSRVVILRRSDSDQPQATARGPAKGNRC